MAFEDGNQEGKKRKKPWRDAIDRALARHVTGKIDYLALDAVADRLVEDAIAGKMDAIKEIGDRIDGKPKQQLTGGDEGDTPLIPSSIEIILKNAPRDT